MIGSAEDVEEYEHLSAALSHCARLGAEAVDVLGSTYRPYMNFFDVKLKESAYNDTEFLQAALDAAGIGTFRFDTRTAALTCDDRLIRLAALSDGNAATPDGILSAIDHRDREKILNALQSGGVFEEEFRVSDRCFEARGRNTDGIVHRTSST